MPLIGGFKPQLLHEETYRKVGFKIFTRTRDGLTWGVFDDLPPNHPYDWSRYMTDAEALAVATPEAMKSAIDRCLDRRVAYTGDLRYRFNPAYRQEHP